MKSMSTVAPPSKPLSPALVDSEHYIDVQIRRTRRALKLVDLAAGLITLAIGLFVFVLLAAVLDHWVVPGGLSELGRIAVFGLMLVALAWYGWRQFIPLLRPINPVYAAHTIERNAPSLKNSLLNLLWFRTHRQPMSARVYHALEQQAAQRLSSAPVDASIDRGALLRLGYALLAIVAVCALYAVLSPKDMAVSAARVLAPWSDLAAPSRVQIVDIKPGEISIATGEYLEISAEIRGLRDDERVRIHYSTIDQQTVDQTAPMKLPEANARRFQGELPRRGSDASDENAGVQQDLVYWIEAGDARSRKYAVGVFTRPTIIVQKVRYDYPAYTGFPSNETESTGDVRGIEGTTVTISALANKPIKNAYVDFDADGRSDLKMSVDGQRATAIFPLALREDRRTPTHVSYVLRFTSTEDRTNIDPPKYRIDVTPDYAPEVRVTAPEEPELTVRVDEVVPIGVEARDPDFALAEVRLVGKVKNREATLAELLTARHEGRFGAIKPITPGEAKLKPGDVLEYWAEARDNRRPEANIAASEHRRLRIAGPSEPGRPGPGEQNPQQQPGGQQKQGGEQQDGGNAQDGQQGEGGESASADGQSAQPQEGPQNGQNDGGENQGQQGAGGQGQNAQAQPNDSQQQNQQGGGAGGANSQQADQQNEQQQQPQNGANNGANSGQSEGQQQQKPNQQPQPGNQGGSQSNNPNERQGQPQAAGSESDSTNGEGAAASGQQSNSAQQQSQPQEKVSSQGDEDSTAMQRMMEHLNEQNQQNQHDGSAEQNPANAQQQGQPQDAANSQEQTGQGQQQSAQDRQGEQPTGENAQARPQGENAQNSNAQPREQTEPQESGEAASADSQQQQQANAQPGKPSAAQGQSKNQSNQKPPVDGAQSKGPQETASDAQQQTNPAGQNPSERQGAAKPREARNGDGNPNDPKNAQQPSPDSAMNPNNGDAGSGGSTGEEQGSPQSEQQSHKRARDKTDEDNAKRSDDKEPPMASPDKRESNSRGGQGGEQSGGGQEGSGQKADAQGKGEAGQHEAADEGAGRADEQGEGETGTEGGDQQRAQGKTGQSSGNQQGQGSQQGEATGSDPAASGPGEQPDSENAQTKPQPKPGAQAGEGSAAPGQASQQQSDAQPANQNEQPQNNQSGQQPPSDQPSAGQSGSAQPQGGGQGSGTLSSQPPLSDEEKADEANLDFARRQTNLVLESLDQQLGKKQVDQNLLKNLGWTEQELQQFVNRWKDLKSRAASEGDKGGEASAELDDALRSLGLRKQEPTRANVQSKADKLQVNDSYRSRAPLEYADRVRAYSKNVASEDK